MSLFVSREYALFWYFFLQNERMKRFVWISKISNKNLPKLFLSTTDNYLWISVIEACFPAFSHFSWISVIRIFIQQNEKSVCSISVNICYPDILPAKWENDYFYLLQIIIREYPLLGYVFQHFSMFYEYPLSGYSSSKMRKWLFLPTPDNYP